MCPLPSCCRAAAPGPALAPLPMAATAGHCSLHSSFVLLLFFLSAASRLSAPVAYFLASPGDARLLPPVGGWAACRAGCPFGALLPRGSFRHGSEHLLSLLAVEVLSFPLWPLVSSVLGVHGFFPDGEVAE